MAMSTKYGAWMASFVAALTVVGLLSSSKTRLLRSRSVHHHQQHRRLTTTDTWSDPKSIYVKQSAAVDQGGLESLRYVAFGTSRTWGAGLKNPDREAYIKLLSPHGLNLGLRATLSDYPSLCLHSMIGDRVFDVIIVEFPPYNGKHDDFARLLQRLRGRFPHAIILYLPVAMPMNEFRYQNQNLQRYLISRGVATPRDPAFAKTIRHLHDADLEYLASAYEKEAYFQTVHSVGGHVVEFPHFQEENLKSYIIDSVKYFGSKTSPWDAVHPSNLGHEHIAEKLRHVLSEIRSQPPPPSTENAVVGTWVGGQDRCLTWFSNGNVTEEVRDVQNMMLVNFALDQEKWALEVFRTGGSFSVFCSFPQCSIYLSYMGMGPKKEYPRVMVSVNGKEPTMVDPHISQYHLRQLSYVGTVDMPGWATVKVDPLNDGPMHLRITGVITTPAQVN